MYVFLISFKKEHLSKKVLLLLYCKQNFRPYTFCVVIQITFLNLFKTTWKESLFKKKLLVSFFSLHEKKKNAHEKS